jgi:hypothetical protein
VNITDWLPTVGQLLKNFSAFYGTRRFITMFARAHHWSLSWSRWIQSIPTHAISLSSILILYPYLHLDLPSDLFPCGFPIKTLYAFLFSPMPATCPALGTSLANRKEVKDKIRDQLRKWARLSFYSLYFSRVHKTQILPVFVRVWKVLEEGTLKPRWPKRDMTIGNLGYYIMGHRVSLVSWNLRSYDELAMWLG